MHGIDRKEARPASGAALDARRTAGKRAGGRGSRRRAAADGARQDRLSVRRRQDRLVGAGLADDRADVRRILHPEDADAPLPDRDDPRRQPDRHQLHRHAGRPRRLGAVFRAARPRGLCGRSGGARPLGAFLAVAGQGRRRQSRAHRAALHRAGALQSVAAGQAAHAMARHRQAGDPVVRRSSTPRSFRRWSSFQKQQEINRDAGDRAVRQDRARGADDPFAVGHLHLADRRRTAESRQGGHRGRAERPAGLRDRVQGRAGVVRRHGQARSARASARCRSPTIRRSRTARSSPSCARTSRTSPISCAAGSRPSRRASCRTSPAFRC